MNNVFCPLIRSCITGSASTSLNEVVAYGKIWDFDSPLGHVPRLIRAIFRSFLIFYFTDLLMSFSCFSFNPSVLMRRVQCDMVVDSLHEIPVSYCFSYGPT